MDQQQSVAGGLSPRNRAGSLLFGAGPIGPWPVEAAGLLLRVHVGLSIAINAGLPKVTPFPAAGWFVEQVTELGFPAPGLFAFIAAWVEVIGGFLVALGLLTRPAAALLAIHFAVAAFMYHKVFPLVDLQIAHTLFWVFLALAGWGGGRVSIDQLLRKRGGAVS